MVRQRRAEHGEHDYDYDFDEDQSKDKVTCKQHGDTNTKHIAPMYTNNDRISQGENTLDISDPFQKNDFIEKRGSDFDGSPADVQPLFSFVRGDRRGLETNNWPARLIPPASPSLPVRPDRPTRSTRPTRPTDPQTSSARRAREGKARGGTILFSGRSTIPLQHISLELSAAPIPPVQSSRELPWLPSVSPLCDVFQNIGNIRSCLGKAQSR